MKKLLSIILATCLMLTVLPLGRFNLTASAETRYSGITSTANYTKLRNYINSYGSLNSDGYKYISMEDSYESMDHSYFINNRASDIRFLLHTEIGNAANYLRTEFILDPDSKTLSVENSIMIYQNYDYDTASNTLSIDRSKHTKDSIYTLQSGGKYMSSSDVTDLFNSHFALFCVYLDGYLYSNLGFGLKGLGFVSYSGSGLDVCDIVSSYHIGNNETRNASSATCVSDGYTGDIYCTNCGEKRASGSVIPSNENHKYDNDYDKICNLCGDEREVLLQNGWVNEGGKWYYYKADGTLAKGWVQVGNTWYYMNSEGAMQTGWLKSGNTWYYLKSGGAMATGWEKVNGTYYYFNGSGAMQTGWLKSGNTWYYLKSSGAMATGWEKVNGTYYYFNGSGAMQTGWLKSGNTWYYLKDSGAMATGWANVNGTYYYFNGSGAMQTGWLKLGNTWYYLKDSGAMATGSLKIGNKWYRFNSSGAWIA